MEMATVVPWQDDEWLMLNAMVANFRKWCTFQWTVNIFFNILKIVKNKYIKITSVCECSWQTKVLPSRKYFWEYLSSSFLKQLIRGRGSLLLRQQKSSWGSRSSDANGHGERCAYSILKKITRSRSEKFLKSTR